MNGSNFQRAATLAIGLLAAPLALAHVPPLVAAPPPFAFIGMMAGFGMVMVLGIITIVMLTNSRAVRDRLALVEKLVTDGKPVPRELLVNEPTQLTLPEERRRDIRRGIALLCWGIGVGVVFYLVSRDNSRAAAWGLLLIVPALGNFVKAWLTAREIARGPSNGAR
jgi:hypothetical protein